MSPETDIFRSGTRGHSWFFFSLNIDNKMHFVSISIAFWHLTHLYVIRLHGIIKVPIKTFHLTLISSSNIETNNQYYKITCKCVTWLCFSNPNYVVCLKNLYELCNATATTARRSFDVAGKIAFVLWRHGQRCNGTMPTMGLALLCLLLQESARIPRARSPSRIERSRTRLPMGLRSLMCEKVKYSLHENSLARRPRLPDFLLG